jgi:hypothetical protein
VVPDDSDDVPHRLGRRTFVKGLGATAAGGLGVKYGVQDADALALTTAALVGVAAGAAAGLAFGMTIGGPDDSDVASSLSWQTHVDEFTRAREDQLMVEQTTASLKRDVQLVGNKAREEAIFRIFEQGVDSGTQSDATAAAEAAINETFATVEKSIYNSYHLRVKRLQTIGKLINGSTDPFDTADFIDDDRFIIGNNVGDTYATEGGSFAVTTKTKTLYDGTTVDYLAGKRSFSSSVNAGGIMLDPDPTVSPPSSTYLSKYLIAKPDPADYSTQDTALDVSYNRALLIDNEMWRGIAVDLDAQHTSLMGEVSSMVSSYFEPAQNGKIDLYEAVGPKHLTDTAQTATDYEEASMALRAMGYPMSEQVVTIAVPTEDGGTQELTGRLSWTAHQGNSLDVGMKHGPSNIPGSIYAAVNIPDGIDSLNSTNTTNTTSTTDTGPGAEIIELVDEFEILEAGGADGVTFKDRSLAEVDATSNEEINKIYKENYQANKEATETVHDTATGGGGGLSWSGLTSMEKGIALVAGGLGAWALLGDD